jgi:hypothetical protein
MWERIRSEPLEHRPHGLLILGLGQISRCERHQVAILGGTHLRWVRGGSADWGPSMSFPVCKTDTASFKPYPDSFRWGEP